MRTGDEMDAGIFAFERTDAADGKKALVVMNVNEKHASTTAFGTAKMKVGFAPGTGLVSVFPDATLGVQVGGDGTVAVTVPARGTVVLVPQADMAGIK